MSDESGPPEEQPAESGGRDAESRASTASHEQAKGLQADRDRLEAVTQSIGAGLAIISRDYRTVWANGVLKETFGEVEGRPCYSAYNQRSSVCPGCGVREVFEAGRERAVHEQLSRDPAGNVVWSQIVATPIRDEEGNVTAALEVVMSITERKRAEEALRQSREEFRYIIDNTWDIIFRIDLEGNYTFVNKAAERLTGYSGEELLSMNMLQLVAPEHQQFVLGRLKKRMAGETLEQPFDFEIVTKAGERVVVELTTTAIHDKDGKLLGVQGIVRDVTERRHAEEALRESEERFRAIFDNATDGILLADLEDRRFHTGNKRICQMLGYTLEELRTLGVADIHLEKHLPRVLEQFQRQSEGEITVAEDSPVKRKDGSVFYADISAAPVTLRGTTYLLGIFRDITKRKLAEEALRRNEERFRALVERGTSVYAIIGPDGTTLYESPSLERVYGWKPEEIVGKSIFELVHPDDVEFAVQTFGELVRKPGVEKTAQIRYRHKNGTWREIEVIGVNHVDDPAIGGIVLTSHDVTERKRVEKALRESEEFHRTMVDALPEALTKSDLEGRVTYASRQAVEMYGAESAEEIVGKNAFTFIAPEDRERAMANLQRTLREGAVRNLEYTLLRKDGTRYPGEMSAAVVLDADGNPREFIAVTRDITERKLAEKKLREAEETREQLAVEVAALRTEMQEKYGLDNIIAQDPKMHEVFETVLAVGPTQASVFIHGETGTGKELIAKAVHYSSPRRDRPFVKVDCGALVETLLESELFGHVKGAFTNAVRDRSGRFGIADGGTIFLDEIHNMSARLQAKLLRVAQEGRFEKVGSSATQEVDVRIIAATNEDLEALVEENRFRKDLYYRLNVVPIHIPPLRERRSDVPLLAQSFIRRFAERHGRKVTGISREAVEKLMGHDWPGNVRELENVIEQAVVLCTADTIGPEDLRLPEKAPAGGPMPLPGSLKEAVEDFEKQTVVAVMERSGGKKSRAAGLLGISRSTLYEKLKRHGLLGRRW